MADFVKRPNVKVQNMDAVKAQYEEREVKEVENTPEEETQLIRANEEDFIQGLIDAAGFSETETQKIEIVRDGKLFFAFSIRPLSEEEYDKCKKKNTKYVRNKNFGMKLPEEVNNIRFRSQLIYTATIEEDRNELWDNKKVWQALRNKNLPIANGIDVIEYTLKAGEKDRILECIDLLSGYEVNLEEVVKN